MDITLTLLIIVSVVAYRYYRRFRLLEHQKHRSSHDRRHSAKQKTPPPIIEDIDYEEVD